MLNLFVITQETKERVDAYITEAVQEDFEQTVN